MRKSSKWPAGTRLVCLFGCFVIGTLAASPADSPGTSVSVSDALLQNAKNEIARIQALVDEGVLPKVRLDEARARFADAQDEAVLSRALYGGSRLQDITSDQADAMIQAAQRRVDRQSRIVDNRRDLLDKGILARSEFAGFQDELDSRRRVLELARNRARLLDDLRRMAEVEQQSERAAASASASALKDAMIHYDGNGLFNLGDLPTISAEFEKRFHHSMPISALGQTLVHQAMGLDHRNRVDVALNPEQPEGIWLRGLLESLRVPYVAFRSAVAGAATAPHIHIGAMSTRLKLAQR